MKNSILRFLVSRAGGILTPIVAVIVGTVLARLSQLDPSLAGRVNEGEVTAFVVALILTLVNYFTNVTQADGIRRIQAVVNTDVDGVAGPVTYTEVRQAVAVKKKAAQKKR